MASRQADEFDRAAMLYIKRTAEEKGITRGELARRADVGYDTLRNYWDYPDRVAPFGVIRRLVSALGVEGTEAYDEIDRIATSIDRPTDS